LVNEHALTRTVRDSAALLDAVAGTPGDPYTAPAESAFPASDHADTRRAAHPDRHGIAVSGPTTHLEVVAAVERTGTVLDGLGHVVEPGAPAIDADAVADAIAVLHNVSNAQLHDGDRALGANP
jgi:amidase